MTKASASCPAAGCWRVPAARFYLQLIEPELDDGDDGREQLQRVAFGTADVLGAVAALRARGVGFLETPGVHTDRRGALTRTWLGGTMFELVHIDPPRDPAPPDDSNPRGGHAERIRP